MFVLCMLSVPCLALAEDAKDAAMKLPPHVPSILAEEYTLAPGDMLEVTVWEEPDLSQAVTVRPDGRITYPLVREIMAAGKTIAQLREEMETEIYKIVPDVPVSIVLTATAKRFYVIGESGSSAYPLTGPIRVMQALALAGGITEFGDKDIIILRDLGDEQQVIEFDYGKVEDGKKLEQNVFLMSNDTIIVR